MKQNLYDTIAAIATPLGEGGISVIRSSGDYAFKIMEKIFFKSKDKTNIFSADGVDSHTIHFGYLFDGDELIDVVLISVFKSPNSYTGEDVVEISSHGGIFLVNKIMNVLMNHGVRHAEPGEFTKRAFLNGRIDLAQAEAVADLITAKTEKAHQSSIKQLEGSLSELVHKTRQELIDLTSLIELELDFAEEDLEFVNKNDLLEKFKDLIARIETIIDSYISGKIIREGINLVIAGKPNTGKSSLFNELLKSDRAIVSEIEGTTRDYLQESIIIKGYVFNLIDTAGLRFAEDLIESEGIKRSLSKINQADLVLYLIDSSKSETERAEEFGKVKTNIRHQKLLTVYSKADLLSNDKEENHGIFISINDPNSIERLKEKMIDKILKEVRTGNSSEITLTNLRHKVCLENVVLALRSAVVSIENSMSGEFISVDLRNAMSSLGEITGEVTNDELLANIFGKFCIGK